MGLTAKLTQINPLERRLLLCYAPIASQQVVPVVHPCRGPQKEESKFFGRGWARTARAVLAHPRSGLCIRLEWQSAFVYFSSMVC